MDCPFNFYRSLMIGVFRNLLPSEHARAWRAAHGRGHEGVGERSPALLHDAASLVHGLHGACGGRRGETQSVIIIILSLNATLNSCGGGGGAPSPSSWSWSSVRIRMMFGRMLRRSLWRRGFRRCPEGKWAWHSVTEMNRKRRSRPAMAFDPRPPRWRFNQSDAS